MKALKLSLIKIKVIISFIVFILFISCNHIKKINPELIEGNWSLVRNDTYELYYFNNDEMYTYEPYSENIVHFNYFIVEDSLYRCFVHPELLNKDYVFYDKIVKLDSFNLEFRKIELERLQNSQVGLDSYLLGKISRRNFLLNSLRSAKQDSADLSM
ncbi:hypothetical protein [Aquimarina brevivitae]|uniref:Lipocalin-like protein n=1 Tax=Aquimarina brevivitae TaxID=323412 RepID=A0A4Q7P193_9FLAO|nr:hypothetical protein [Aquimarina brevivitae]RZS93140.1 hypothetical protein EV197_1710 [Aquimarina brevivitae]